VLLGRVAPAPPVPSVTVGSPTVAVADGTIGTDALTVGSPTDAPEVDTLAPPPPAPTTGPELLAPGSPGTTPPPGAVTAVLGTVTPPPAPVVAEPEGPDVVADPGSEAGSRVEERLTVQALPQAAIRREVLSCVSRSRASSSLSFARDPGGTSVRSASSCGRARTVKSRMAISAWGLPVAAYEVSRA
jgi:hypothetical protein